MQISATIEKATLLAPSIWEAEVSPSHIRQLGNPAATIGAHSVLLIDAPDFDTATGSVRFALNAVRVLNLGTASKAILIAAEGQSGPTAIVSSTLDMNQKSQARAEAKAGLGDRQLLQQLHDFPEPMKEAAEAVIQHIRAIDPGGDLQRQGKRFVNRRDNFVAVEVQSRKQQLLINVRGRVPTSLPTLSTFNGYTAFKLSKPADLAAVCAAIDSATRK